MLPMIRVILFVFGTTAISSVLAAQHESNTKTDVEAITVSQLVGSWGGGEEVDKSWKLNRLWVGKLNEVVTLGEYKEGGYLETKEKSKAVRFSVLHGGFRCGSSKKDCIALIAMGKRSFSTSAIYRDKLPTLVELRDRDKIVSILTEFGEPRGWTDGWGMNNEMHWTEGWTWFTTHGIDQLRVLDVFAHVSQTKEQPRVIDHMRIREAYCRFSDPKNAEDLQIFPLQATLDDERQKRIDLQDASQPEPLRSLLKAKHTEGDSELKAFFAAIHAFREQPDADLLKQLVANLDEGTCEIKGMTGDLFRSTAFDSEIGKWNPSMHKVACQLLVKSLPSARSRESMMNALEIALAETGIETLEIDKDGIAISMHSRSREGVSSVSYSRFEIPNADIAKVGGDIRDHILRIMK